MNFTTSERDNENTWNAFAYDVFTKERRNCLIYSNIAEPMKSFLKFSAYKL